VREFRDEDVGMVDELTAVGKDPVLMARILLAWEMLRYK
jgi:hypothetical protein